MYSNLQPFAHSKKYIYIYIYVCVYICMYVCVYVCVHRPQNTSAELSSCIQATSTAASCSQQALPYLEASRYY